MTYERDRRMDRQTKHTISNNAVWRPALKSYIEAVDTIRFNVYRYRNNISTFSIHRSSTSYDSTDAWLHLGLYFPMSLLSHHTGKPNCNYAVWNASRQSLQNCTVNTRHFASSQSPTPKLACPQSQLAHRQFTAGRAKQVSLEKNVNISTVISTTLLHARLQELT